MPWDKEKAKQYKKVWRENNKERIKQKDKEWVEKNKERRKQTNKQWYENNKERHKQHEKEYRQTEQGKKVHTIKRWRRQGIIFHDYDLLYDICKNTEKCDLCNCKLTEGKLTKTSRCVDHDHLITDCDNVRNILCLSCNASLPTQ